MSKNRVLQVLKYLDIYGGMASTNTMQKAHHYKKVAEAIAYLNDHAHSQPNLKEMAAHLQLSPFHFQRVFSEWVGLSPKKYLQWVTASHAKGLLRNEQRTLFDTAHETGLSGTGRLHDLFVHVEGMTPGVYRKGGVDLMIRFSFEDSVFGRVLIASTDRGICHLAFVDGTEDDALIFLKNRFPNARYMIGRNPMQAAALRIISGDFLDGSSIRLHLKGSPFQIKVWEALLKIPYGRLQTYGNVARGIDRPTASRAVGTAIGANPVAYLIPCHRVIRQSGHFGGYRWDPVRKQAMIGWETHINEQ